MSGFLAGLRTSSVASHLLNQTTRQRRCTCMIATTTSILVIATVFGFTAFNLHQNQFGANQFHVHVGDEVAISRFSDDLSAKFCSAYEIQIWDRAEVYLLPSQAKVNVTEFKQEHFEIRYDRDMMVLNSRAFYLLPNSSVDVTGCRASDSGDARAEMVLGKGDDFFHHWHPDLKHKDEVKRVEIPPSEVCNESASELPTLDYIITEEDTYYIILFQSESHHRKRRLRSGDVFLNGTLRRTLYDVSSAIDECVSRSVCRFSLDYHDGSVDVVIHIHGNPVTPIARSSFSTRCQARVAFWVGIFGGIPLLLIAVIVSFWAWMLCFKSPSRQRTASQRSRSTTNASLEEGREEHLTSQEHAPKRPRNYSALGDTAPLLSTQESENG